MKKKILKIVAVVLAVVIVAGGITAYALLPHALSYDIKSVPFIGSELEIVSETEDEVTVKKDGEFKVLFFTDTHFDGKNKTSQLTAENLVDNIVSEKPDLVIFNGDNVTSAFNRKRCNQLAEIFEKLGVYWAGGLGNHEGDNSMSLSREEMVDIFSSYEHCLMREGPAELSGEVNYVLTVLNGDDSIRHAFYFLDTGDEASAETEAEYNIPDDGKTHYDGTKPDQVAWYTAENNALKEKYGDFNSTLVVHIPLYQMKAEAENGDFVYGEKLEGVCASAFDSGMFDALKEGGTTKTAFFGHDHLNTFALEKDGILLAYLQPSGYGSYTAESRLGYEEKDWLQGYTSVLVAENGELETAYFRNSEKGE